MTRIFIPTKNRQTTISTHRYFKDYDYKVVVHTDEQAAAYINHSSETELDPSRIIVSHVQADEFGLTRQREWVVEKMCKKGEWIVFADDNIRDIQAVEKSLYPLQSLDVEHDASLRPMFNERCEPERFMNVIVPEAVGHAISTGAHHVGFATTDNFFYRGKHWKDVGYIIGKLMIWNCHDQVFDHAITMEDFELTAQAVLKYGAAPVNNWVYPVAGHYEAGGMGTKEERLPARKRDIIILLEKYPSFFTVKERSDGNPDLGLRLHQHKQIEQWRAYMRSIGKV